MQSSIPAVFMRGGTSRGLYFKKADLSDNRDLWDDILLKAFGLPDPRQVDGVGGTTSVTSKSCILSPSERDDCDIDYLFAQLAVDEAKVDYAPTCGNMLAGVGGPSLQGVQASAPILGAAGADERGGSGGTVTEAGGNDDGDDDISERGQR